MDITYLPHPSIDVVVQLLSYKHLCESISAATRILESRLNLCLVKSPYVPLWKTGRVLHLEALTLYVTACHREWQKRAPLRRQIVKGVLRNNPNPTDKIRKAMLQFYHLRDKLFIEDSNISTVPVLRWHSAVHRSHVAHMYEDQPEHYCIYLDKFRIATPTLPNLMPLETIEPNGVTG